MMMPIFVSPAPTRGEFLPMPVNGFVLGYRSQEENHETDHQTVGPVLQIS